MFDVIKYINSDFSRYLWFHKKHVDIFLFVAVFFHNPGMLFSILYRIEHTFLTSKSIFFHYAGVILQPFYYIMTYYVLDIDIDPTVKVGKGLYVHNRGIIVSATTTIGNNCTILGPITIGMNLNGLKAPSIRNNVTVCTGARIIGDISIGNNVIVGANAVVIRNVRSGVIVGGVPAVILKKNPQIS